MKLSFANIDNPRFPKLTLQFRFMMNLHHERYDLRLRMKQSSLLYFYFKQDSILVKDLKGSSVDELCELQWILWHHYLILSGDFITTCTLVDFHGKVAGEWRAKVS